MTANPRRRWISQIPESMGQWLLDLAMKLDTRPVDPCPTIATGRIHLRSTHRVTNSSNPLGVNGPWRL